MHGQKMLLHFLHSLHPCNLAISEDMGCQKKLSVKVAASNDFLYPARLNVILL